MTDPEILISRYFEDPESMTPHDAEELSQWIKQDRAHAKRFAQAAFVHRGIYDSLTSEQTQEALTVPPSAPAPDDSGFSWDDHFWHWIAEYEKTAPTMDIEKPDPGPQPPQKTEPAQSTRKTNRTLLLVSAFCVTAVLLVCAVAEIGRRLFPPDVATLRSSLRVAWADATALESGGRLARGGAPLRLTRGMVAVVFDSGAEAVIEAPAQFRLKSTNRIELQSGRLFATVGQSARGFTVETPCGRVVDLGTEFGLKVDSGRSSDLHMFKGQVSLAPAQSGWQSQSQIITAGQANSIDAAGQVRSIQVDDAAFVRRFFPKTGCVWRGRPIDLADILGGGDGCGTGKVGRWLEISTGTDGTRYIVDGKTTTPMRTTDNRYHRVSHLRYVDGVFSPNGQAGPVQVSSEGNTWRDCPATSGGFFEDIFNGDHIAVEGGDHGLVLNGQAYGTKEYPAIAVHSNAGITFDLAALRRDLPGLQLVEFRALCGLSEDVRQYANAAVKPKNVDFWVLVDGEKRFEARAMEVSSSPREISVTLSGEERFLTLVTTDCDGKSSYDWGLFAEPRLEVSAAPGVAPHAGGGT